MKFRWHRIVAAVSGLGMIGWLAVGYAAPGGKKGIRLKPGSVSADLGGVGVSRNPAGFRVKVAVSPMIPAQSANPAGIRVKVGSPSITAPSKKPDAAVKDWAVYE